MGLRARRALVVAAGDLLAVAERHGRPTAALASEATDAIDDGLAIARAFEESGVSRLRSLAVRLFRLGSQLYGNHQPQFLGEFVLETLGSPALAGDVDFQRIAAEGLAATLRRLQGPRLILGGTSEAEQLLATARSLRAAQVQVSLLIHHVSPAPALT
jgi:hypothetical protein